ncbi:TonB-dependent receptor family protein, partial [Methylicorpusculum sp.]|uniref:TonB-dependent receptor family protein n=1 Tax=Methylicorpusculum sp. TaxID=2713644 RepID=UPI002ABB8C3C
DRKQASPNALIFDTRVSKSHEQVGAIIEHKLNENNTIRAMTYFGQRDNEQYLSVPIGAQNNPLNGGGVSIIDRNFGGIDLRWTTKGNLLALPYTLTAGANYDFMEDERKGFENFVGGTGNACGVNGRVCGQKGTLRRDESNSLFNFDQYLQASLDVDPRLGFSGGIRHSRVRFKSEDDYITAGNPDDGGSKTLSKTTPVIGTIFKLTETVNLFANAGKSFETPTFVEIAFNPDSTQSGLNLDLKPSTSNNYELGVKALVSNTLINLALFKIDTEDEIVVNSSIGGRTSFRNISSSERKGLELSLDSQLTESVKFYLAYTLLDAEFNEPFKGSKIPGTYRYTLFSEVSWRHTPSGFSSALEMRKFSETNVSFNSDDGKADAYTVFSLRAGFNQKVGNWKLNEFVRVENIFDQEYVGSVRVADGNGRFYEAAPTRNWLLGLNASYQF